MMSSRPSAWRARAALAVLAACGLGVSLYLAAYQLGFVRSPWDPVFGPASSGRVLHSALSRALPVPDALLGALAYALELVLDLVGGDERWRTHPWIVLAFSGVSFAMGASGVGLTLMQLLVVRSACSLCLVSAGLSIAIAVKAAVGRELPAAFEVVSGRRARRNA